MRLRYVEPATGLEATLELAQLRTFPSTGPTKGARTGAAATQTVPSAVSTDSAVSHDGSKTAASTATSGKSTRERLFSLARPRAIVTPPTAAPVGATFAPATAAAGASASATQPAPVTQSQSPPAGVSATKSAVIANDDGDIDSVVTTPHEGLSDCDSEQETDTDGDCEPGTPGTGSVQNTGFVPGSSTHTHPVGVGNTGFTATATGLNTLSRTTTNAESLSALIDPDTATTAAISATATAAIAAAPPQPTVRRAATGPGLATSAAQSAAQVASYFGSFLSAIRGELPSELDDPLTMLPADSNSNVNSADAGRQHGPLPPPPLLPGPGLQTTAFASASAPNHSSASSRSAPLAPPQSAAPQSAAHSTQPPRGPVSAAQRGVFADAPEWTEAFAVPAGPWLRVHREIRVRGLAIYISTCPPRKARTQRATNAASRATTSSSTTAKKAPVSRPAMRGFYGTDCVLSPFNVRIRVTAHLACVASWAAACLSPTQSGTPRSADSGSIDNDPGVAAAACGTAVHPWLGFELDRDTSQLPSAPAGPAVAIALAAETTLAVALRPQQLRAFTESHLIELLSSLAAGPSSVASPLPDSNSVPFAPAPSTLPQRPDVLTDLDSEAAMLAAAAVASACSFAPDSGAGSGPAVPRSVLATPPVRQRPGAASGFLSGITSSISALTLMSLSEDEPQSPPRAAAPRGARGNNAAYAALERDVSAQRAELARRVLPFAPVHIVTVSANAPGAAVVWCRDMPAPTTAAEAKNSTAARVPVAVHVTVRRAPLPFAAAYAAAVAARRNSAGSTGSESRTRASMHEQASSLSTAPASVKASDDGPMSAVTRAIASVSPSLAAFLWELISLPACVALSSRTNHTQKPRVLSAQHATPMLTLRLSLISLALTAPLPCPVAAALVPADAAETAAAATAAAASLNDAMLSVSGLLDDDGGDAAATSAGRQRARSVYASGAAAVANVLDVVPAGTTLTHQPWHDAAIAGDGGVLLPLPLRLPRVPLPLLMPYDTCRPGASSNAAVDDEDDEDYDDEDEDDDNNDGDNGACGGLPPLGGRRARGAPAHARSRAVLLPLCTHRADPRSSRTPLRALAHPGPLFTLSFGALALLTH